MGKVHVGINLEFVRHADKNLEWAVAKAAQLGYDYVEPMVHWGRELLSEAGYFHSVSMFDDPLRIKRACAKAGVKLSGLSAHTPLCKPEIGVEYLKQAIRFAAASPVDRRVLQRFLRLYCLFFSLAASRGGAVSCAHPFTAHGADGFEFRSNAPSCREGAGRVMGSDVLQEIGRA